MFSLLIIPTWHTTTRSYFLRTFSGLTIGLPALIAADQLISLSALSILYMGRALNGKPSPASAETPTSEMSTPPVIRHDKRFSLNESFCSVCVAYDVLLDRCHKQNGIKIKPTNAVEPPVTLAIKSPATIILKRATWLGRNRATHRNGGSRDKSMKVFSRTVRYK